MTDLNLCRSLLFVPASNDRALQKARELDADLIVIDLEDSVTDTDKPAAREAAIAASSEGYGGRPVALRVNRTNSPYYGEDVVAARRAGVDYIVLPKAESAKQAADCCWLLGKPVMAMIETPRGVIEAAAIAPAARALIAGTNDLAVSLGLPLDSDRRGLVYALQRIVLAAKAAGMPAFDGVYNRLEADQGLEAQCEEGSGFGFDGKCVIHPSQIDTVNRLFSPNDEEVAAAKRLIAAATGGAERHEGQMIEALHVEQARTLLAKARAG
ncbi:MAG: HpcH/HpaI aldolase/citrate lyase family protein [Sphingosinicella sp.]